MLGPIRTLLRRRSSALAAPLALLGLAGCSGGTSSGVGAGSNIPFVDEFLTAEEVQTILAQGVTQAIALGVPSVIAVSDRDGNVLGVFRMFDFMSDSSCFSDPNASQPGCTDPGGRPLLNPDAFRADDAISNASTAAYFQSHEDAFTTRTARFIVLNHFPPDVDGTPGGPLYGVEYSSVNGSDDPNIMGVDTDINPIARDAQGRPAGGSISGFFGGVALFRNGHPVGGVGVVGCSLDEEDPERIALAAQAGFEPPNEIRADRILIDGIRFVYVETEPINDGDTLAFSALPGCVETRFPVRASPGHPAYPRRMLGGVMGEVYCDFAGALGDPNNPSTCGFRQSIDPPPGSNVNEGGLTVEEIEHIVAGAASRAHRTRAAIRRPIGTPAQVFITVVDRAGNILAIFRTPDATIFSLDVAVQKARTCVFFSDDQVAFTSRAIGFLSQGLYPPGIDGTDPGPLKDLQTFLTVRSLRCVNRADGTLGTPVFEGNVFPCDLDEFYLLLDLGFETVGGRIPNGITIFPGGVPLYRDGRLIGAVGISGDGVDQDDIISDSGADAEGFNGGFQAPRDVRCDFRTEDEIIERLLEVLTLIRQEADAESVRERARINIGQLMDDRIEDLRLPWVKFPRHPGT